MAVANDEFDDALAGYIVDELKKFGKFEWGNPFGFQSVSSAIGRAMVKSGVDKELNFAKREAMTCFIWGYLYRWQPNNIDWVGFQENLQEFIQLYELV